MAADPACARLDQLAQQRQCSEALEEISRCGNAFFGAVRSASCMEEVGDYERAKELYAMAIQIEPRSRTRPSYNALIRSRAIEHRLPLADLAATMEARSPHGLSGTVDFIDHVHLTCMGYLPMARSIVEAIIAAKLVPGEPLADPSARALLQHYPWNTKGVPPAVSPTWARQVCSPDPDFAG
jgi:hypothetical protein